MPFVCPTEFTWTKEDGFEPVPVDQFVYISPPDYCGTIEPVRFSIVAPDVSPEPQQLETPTRKDRQRQYERSWQQFVAFMVPALREMGARRVYCRYDGGHDEGFAWLDHVEMRTGEKIDVDALSQHFTKPNGLTRFHDLGIESFADGLGWLCDHCVAMLLGESYGTGEYVMYGAFVIDLDECWIADDEGADPVVKNIAIAE
jgi:hypothetical protein